ncbi:MAG: hypothetical protein ABIW38_01285 [Ferruginibacter sp.]
MIIPNFFFLIFFQFAFNSNQGVEVLQPHAKHDCKQKETVPAAANIIFKSIDGGLTWQDISKGLPENMQGEGFFANDKELYLAVGNMLYHSKPNSTAPFWNKEIFLDEHRNFSPGKMGIFAYNYDGPILQKINGMGIWLPMYPDFNDKRIFNIFETAGGTVFIGTNKGLFKSANGGKSWKLVRNEGWVMKLAEYDGVLIATNNQGILRSTDNGENWDWVIKEGGVGIAAECIQNGFAAITYSNESKTRRVRTSYDGGKTWQRIDVGMPPQSSIASIIQVGENLFCGHPDGIFQSTDKGKTWKLVFPSIKNKVFNLSVSGNVIYAIPRSAGC